MSARTLPRQRLLDPLSALPSWAALVVEGPGGSGRTTLLAQVANELAAGPCRLAWLSLDPDTNEAEFWAVLCARVRSAGLSSRLVAGIEPGRRDATAVARELAIQIDRSGEPALLVVDGLEKLTTAQFQVESALSVLLRSCRSLRLAVAGPENCHLGSAVTRAQTDVVRIGPQQLAFTTEETEEVLRLVAAAANPALARTVHQVTAGWTLGTRILAERADDWASHDADSSAFEGLITCLSPQAPASLTVLAVPESFTPNLAVSLTGLRPEPTAEFLRLMLDAGLVTRDSAGEYRVDPLLREHLVPRLREENPVRYAKACAKTAEDLSARGQGMAAFELCVQAKLWPQVSAIACRWGLTLVADSARFRSLCAQIPAEQYPSLPMVGILLTSAEPELAARTGPTMGQLLARVKPPTVVSGAGGQRVAYAVTQAFAPQFTERRFDPNAFQVVRRAIAELTPSERADSAGCVDYARALCAWAAAMEDLPGAQHELYQLVRSAQARGDHLIRSRATCHLALLTALAGDLPTARSVLDQLTPDDLRYWSAHNPGVEVELARAVIALASLELTDALEIVRAAREKWPEMLQANLAIWLENRALLLSSQAHPLAAVRLSLDRPRLGAQYLTLDIASRAELLLASGQVARASAMVHRAKLDERELWSVKARIALVQGDARKALAIAQTGIAASERHPRRLGESLANAVTAYLRLDLNHHAWELGEQLSSVVQSSGQHAALALIPSEYRTRLAEQVAGTSAEPLLTDPTLHAADGKTAVLGVLAPQEAAVLGLLDTGLTLPAIAEARGTSVNTVKRQVATIYRKLGVTERAEALTVAARYGILPRPG